MAGNNSIQFLRGNNISGSDEELLPGQPAYDLTTKYLYVGDGSKISETSPIKASFADDAENVTSTINGKNISDIFEENGTTAKEATNSPKSLYNLGAYDTYVDNGDGTVTVTRKTGYISTKELTGLNWNKASTPYSYPTFFTDGDSATSIVNNAVMNGGLTFLQGVWENSNTFSVREYPDSVRLDISLSDLESSWSVEDFLSWISQNSIYIEYERQGSYTERLLKNTPLNNLDKNMSDIVRDEVEKTLNLFNGVWEQGTFDPEGGEVYIVSRVRSPKMQLGAGTYSISLSGADDIDVFIFNDDGTLKDETDWLEGNTFTLSESGIISITCRKSDNSDISPEDIQDVMLIKGEHSYPYQPYNGAIVHEKQLGGYLPLTGGTVNGNLSITGQLDFGSLSTRAANALLSMVELSESPLQSNRVSYGGPNAAWSTNGNTWSHSGSLLALGYVTELSTTGNVSSASYNSSTNRITYVISVNQNPGTNVYSGYVRYKYVIKQVK